MTTQDQVLAFFRSIDRDGSGELDGKELQQALALGGLVYGVSDIDAMIRTFSANGRRRLDISEFSALHTVLMRVTTTFTNTAAGRSQLNQQQLQYALVQAGYTLDAPVLAAVLKSHDPTGSNAVTLSEFIRICLFLQNVVVYGLGRSQDSPASNYGLPAQKQGISPVSWLRPNSPSPNVQVAPLSYPNQRERELPSRSAAPPPTPTTCRTKQNQQRDSDSSRSPTVHRFSRRDSDAQPPQSAPQAESRHSPTGRQRQLFPKRHPTETRVGSERYTSKQMAQQLTRGITSATSLGQLSQLVSDSQRCMNPVHISAALSKLAKMHGSTTGKTLKTRAMLAAINGTLQPLTESSAIAATALSDSALVSHTPTHIISLDRSGHAAIQGPNSTDTSRDFRLPHDLASTAGLQPGGVSTGPTLTDSAHVLAEQLLDLMYYWLLQSQAGITQAQANPCVGLSSWDSPLSSRDGTGAWVGGCSMDDITVNIPHSIVIAPGSGRTSSSSHPVSHELEGGLQPRQLSGILHALARLGHVPSSRWAGLFLSVSQPLLASHGFKPQELSMLAWGVAKLELVPRKEWLHALCIACAYRPHAFNSQENSTIVWALATLNHTPSHPWLSAWTSASRDLFHTASAYDLSQLTWSLAKLSALPVQDSVWMDELLSSSASVLPASSHPQDLCNLLWGLAVSGATPGRGWLDPILRSLVNSSAWLHGFKPVDTALLLWGLARMGHRPSDPRILDVLLSTLVDNRERDIDAAVLDNTPSKGSLAGSSSESAAAAAAAAERAKPSQSEAGHSGAGHSTKPVMSASVGDVTPGSSTTTTHKDNKQTDAGGGNGRRRLHVNALVEWRPGPRLSAATPRDLSHVMWALASLGYRPSRRCRQALQAYVQDTLPAFSPQPAVLLLWSHLRLRLHLPQRLLVEFAYTFAAHVDTFQPQGIALALYCFLRYRYQPSPALIEQMVLRVQLQPSSSSLSDISGSSSDASSSDSDSEADSYATGGSSSTMYSSRGRSSSSSADESSACSPHTLSLMVWSLGKLGYKPPKQWLRLTLVHTVHLLPLCSIQELVNLVWGLGVMGYRPAELWLTLLVSSVMPRLVAGEFSPQAVHVLLWGLAQLRYCPPPRFWIAVRKGVEVNSELLKYPGTGKSIIRLRSLVAAPKFDFDDSVPSTRQGLERVVSFRSRGGGETAS